MRKTPAKRPVKKPVKKLAKKSAPARHKNGPLRGRRTEGRVPDRSARARPPGKRRPAAGDKPPPYGQMPRPAAGKAPVAADPAPAPALAPAGPASELDTARPRALDIAQAGLDKKAEDVVVLDVRGLTSYADYVVLMTADSDRQAGAIADAVDERLKERGATKVGVEGYEGGRWILIDYGDVVAHVFNRESRGFYDLEGLWADAPRFSVEG